MVVQVSVQLKNCCGVGWQSRSITGAPPASGPRTAARSAPRPGKPQGASRLHGSHVRPGTGRGFCRTLPQPCGNGWKGHGRIGIRHGRTTGKSDCDSCDWTSLARVECEHRCGDRHPLLHFQPAAKAKLLQAVPRHGRSQTIHHQVMDVAWGDDDSRIHTGHAAYNTTISGPSPTSGLAAVWNKDCLCRLIGLSPKPIEMQSPCRPDPN